MSGRSLRNAIKRTRYPAAAAVSLLALVNPADQLSGHVPPAKAVAGAADTTVVPPVDGGHPLFLAPPPPPPAARPAPESPPAPGNPPHTSAPPTTDHSGQTPASTEPDHAATLPAFGIPTTVLVAYQRAEQRVGQTTPQCHLSWPVLAGIGKVESNHAHNGDVTPDGTLIDPIYGPVLDGSAGNAAISGSRGGWARAAGPMQFIPSTWALWQADGNGDGRADVQNAFDSALAAADYLCADGRDLGTGAGLADAILSYNHSQQYLDTVAAWIRAYQTNGGPVPDQVYGPGTYGDDGSAGPAPTASGGPAPGNAAAPPPSSNRPSPPPPSSSGSSGGSSAGGPSSGGPPSGGTPTPKPSNPVPPAPSPSRGLPAPVRSVLPPPPAGLPPAPIKPPPGPLG